MPPTGCWGSYMGAPATPLPARPRTRRMPAGLELAEMKIEKKKKKAWDAIQNCLALINSYPRRDLPSAPEHPNIVTAAAARPSLAAGRWLILGRRWCGRCPGPRTQIAASHLAGFSEGRWGVGGGKRTAVLMCMAPAVGLQPWLWGTAPLAPQQPARSPKTTPKPLWGPRQHSGGATVGHPTKSAGVPHIPCPCHEVG